MSRPASILVNRKDLSITDLKQLFKKTKDSDKSLRILTIIDMMKHQNAEIVTDFLQVEANTIRRWVQEYNNEDLTSFEKKPPGSSSRLTSEQELKLKQDVLQSPRTLGYEFVNWTGKSAAYHIKIKWGKTLSTRAMIDLFHRLNLTLLHPR
jgi:transposase